MCSFLPFIPIEMMVYSITTLYFEDGENSVLCGKFFLISIAVPPPFVLSCRSFRIMS